MATLARDAKQCGQHFSSRQKLSVHNFRKHSKCREIRHVVKSVHCLYSMQYFFARACHLEEKTPRCRALYFLCCEPLSADDFDSIEVDAAEAVNELAKKGWRRNKVIQLVFHLPGPLPVTCELVGISHAIGLRGRLVDWVFVQFHCMFLNSSVHHSNIASQITKS